MASRSTTLLLATLALAACAPDKLATPTHDAATSDVAPDVSSADAAESPDATAPDSAASDASAPDASAPDVTVADATAPDVMVTDTGVPDAARDASAPDVMIDTPPPDVTPVDAAVPDASVAADYTQLGPHRVALWTGSITGTQGTARVFYPMTAGTTRFPLVVFAHGFQLGVNNYDRVLTHITSWGYVVASVDYPGSILSVDHRNVQAALSAARAAFASGGPSGFPAGARVDAARAVAMGHSLGGKGAIMALLDDNLFAAGLALDPVDDNPSPLGRITDATPSIAPERMGGLMRPLGMFGATQSRCSQLGQSCAPESSDYRQFAMASPPGATVLTWALRNFGHMDFVDPGCGFVCGTCRGGAAPLDSRVAALKAISVAFLERYARGDLSAQSWVSGDRRTAWVRDGTLWDGAASTLPACP